MIDPDSLNIWYGQQLVGYLWRSSGNRINFRYEPGWIDSGGFSISRTLPLTTHEFAAEQEIAHRFFANLLPEGSVRANIIRDLRIPDTDFDLLRAIGGECAGALSILPVEQQPAAQSFYHPMTDEELDRLIKRRGLPYNNWAEDKRPRLSLAGAQDKCPVLVRDNSYFLPQREAPSSHILKFELTDYRHLPAYETFTTLLAQSVNLPVTEIELRTSNQTRYALIKRYDRVTDEQGNLQRLHQEDFCQALGIGHEKKYQENGGPDFARCYQLLLDSSTEPALDAQHLLRWQIFNVLAGNSDGHAKNLSLLYLPDHNIRLAPFYDLVCTRAIERIDYHLAFAVGGERNPSLINWRHWETLAKQCNVNPKFLTKQVQQTAAALLQNLPATRQTFEEKYGSYPALQRIEQVVFNQCRRFTDAGNRTNF